MRLRSGLFLLGFMVASLASCFAHHNALIVNKENAVGNLASAHLARIVRGEVKKWPDGKNIVIVLHADSDGEAEVLGHLTRMSAQDWKSFVAAHLDLFMFVASDADVLREVQAEPGAVGLIEVHAIDSTVNVVKIDRRLPMEIGYLPH